MKWISASLRVLVCLTAAALISCKEDSSTPPGISVESGDISTFPGENVVIKATVSDEVGLESITLTCAALDIVKVYDLSGQKPVVFNVSYQFFVPANTDTSVTAEVVIEARSTSDKRSDRSIPITYLTDTTAPVITTPGSEIGVDFDETTETGEAEAAFSFTDDRGLASARLEIESIGFDESAALSGRSGEVTFYPVFTATGDFDATLTVTDAAGNSANKPLVFQVVGGEPSNPIDDYACMWIANTVENAADYVLGYYQYMTRTAAYTYTVEYYAPAGAQVVFVPTQTLDGPDYYGRSPQSATKILNNKDYVIPVTITAEGYYNITINIQAQTLTLYPHIPASTNPFAADIKGYVWTDGYDNQTTPAAAVAGNPMRLTCPLVVYAVADAWPALQFTDAAWANTWKPLYDSAWAVIGWGHNIDGNGASFGSIGAGTYPTVFDMETMWVTVKKP